MKPLLKFMWVLSVVIIFLLLLLLESLMYRVVRKQKPSGLSPLGITGCKLVLSILGIKIIQTGAIQPAQVYVCNHFSCIDPIVLALYIKQPVFVTSLDAGSKGLTGLITRAAGCLYVDRRSVAQIQSNLDALAQEVRTGGSIVVFPEATTGSGRDVLPFKPAVFNLVLSRGFSCQAFALRVVAKNDLEYEAILEQYAYGLNDTLLSYLYRVCKLSNLKLELHGLPSESKAFRDRKEMALHYREKIRQRIHCAPNAPRQTSNFRGWNKTDQVTIV
jgi:1-acyl-sn-glycerol-3-phosphate acyltransferase